MPSMVCEDVLQGLHGICCVQQITQFCTGCLECKIPVVAFACVQLEPDIVNDIIHVHGVLPFQHLN